MTTLMAVLTAVRRLRPWQIMVAALVAWSGLVGVKAYKRGGEAVISRAKEQGTKNAVKAAKAHDRAKAPGSAERLRRDACRDC